ncbi:MAG TPA: cation transporter, partial [Dehalococcoidia bacterium]|nr:cation transporter [Dehalococcoidia bacterium]
MANAESITLAVRGMTCASCVRRVERVLSRVEGVEAASVNLASETARVTLAAPVELEALAAAVSKAGYDAEEATPELDLTEEHERTARQSVVLLVIGSAFAVPAIVVSMAMDIADVHAVAGSRAATGWTAMTLAGVVQAGLGWRFYRGSFK